MPLRTCKRLAVCAVISLTLASSRSYAQERSNEPELPTFSVESRLALIDVIPEYENKKLHSRGLITDLTREDLRVFDNGQEMPIVSFDIGATHSTRPIALWLIVQCPQGFPPAWASDFLRGDTHHLKPALAHLDPNDAVGVAHWCDNGDADIDFSPGRDPEAALATLEQILHRKTAHGENRTGELTMQRLVHAILENTHSAKSDRLPILLFFYGDHSATYPDEAKKIIEDVLETSGMVFGISDGRWPYDSRSQMSNGQIGYLVHYYSEETGGEFYTTVDPKLFSAALDYILAQLHLRYTIGFKPTVIDGKRHTLKVELTPEAQKRYQGLNLRFRKVYIPVARRAAPVP